LKEYVETIKKAGKAAENGKIEDAFTFYKKAIDMEPKRVDAYYYIAALYHLQGQLDESIVNFEKAAELNPNDASVFNNLGVLYYSKDKLKKAERNFQKAIEIEPNYAESIHGLEKVRIRRGKTKAIFIGGTGRCGTTLFVDLLNTHKDIAAFGETKVVRHTQNLLREFVNFSPDKQKEILAKFKQLWLTKFYKFQATNPTNSKDNWRGLHRWFTKTEILDCLPILDRLQEIYTKEKSYDIYGTFITALFNKYTEKQEKKYWAEKTPANSVYAPFLAQCFDNLKLINIIRDGRDVACSLLKVSWGPDEPREALDWWAFLLKKALTAQKKLPQNSFLNVRYEDIVLKTEPTLHRVIDFLGVDWDDNLFSFNFNRSSIGQYQKELDPETLQYAKDKYGTLLSMLGYSV